MRIFKTRNHGWDKGKDKDAVTERYETACRHEYSCQGRRKRYQKPCTIWVISVMLHPQDVSGRKYERS